MKEKAKPLIEYFTESTTACLVTMVQGNMLLMTIGHIGVAIETGIFAGAATFLIALFAKVNRRGMIALLLGITTSLVDFLVHPGMFGSIATEAIVTGTGAGILSYLVSYLIEVWNKKRKTH